MRFGARRTPAWLDDTQLWPDNAQAGDCADSRDPLYLAATTSAHEMRPIAARQCGVVEGAAVIGYIPRPRAVVAEW